MTQEEFESLQAEMTSNLAEIKRINDNKIVPLRARNEAIEASIKQTLKNAVTDYIRICNPKDHHNDPITVEDWLDDNISYEFGKHYKKENRNWVKTDDWQKQ